MADVGAQLEVTPTQNAYGGWDSLSRFQYHHVSVCSVISCSATAHPRAFRLAPYSSTHPSFPRIFPGAEYLARTPAK